MVEQQQDDVELAGEFREGGCDYSDLGVAVFVGDGRGTGKRVNDEQNRRDLAQYHLKFGENARGRDAAVSVGLE